MESEKLISSEEYFFEDVRFVCQNKMAQLLADTITEKLEQEKLGQIDEMTEELQPNEEEDIISALQSLSETIQICKNAQEKQDAVNQCKNALMRDIQGKESGYEYSIYIGLVENENFRKEFLDQFEKFKIEKREELDQEDIISNKKLENFIADFVDINFSIVMETKHKEGLGDAVQDIGNLIQDNAQCTITRTEIEKGKIAKRNKLLEERCRLFENQLQEQKNENARLSACNFSQNEALKKKKSKIIELDAQIEKLKDQLKNLKIRNRELQDVVNKTDKNKIESTIKENEELKDELNKLKEDYENKRKEAEELKKQNDELKTQISNLKSDNKMSNGKIEKLSEEKKVQENKINEMNNLIEQIKYKSELLKNELEEIRQVQEERIEELEKKKNTISKNLQNAIVNLAKELNKSNKKNQELEQKIKLLKTENCNLARQLLEVTKNIIDVKLYEMTHKNDKKQIEKQSENLEIKEKEITELKEENVNLKNQNQKLNEQIEILKKKNIEMNKFCEYCFYDNQKLETKNRELEFKIQCYGVMDYKKGKNYVNKEEIFNSNNNNFYNYYNAVGPRIYSPDYYKK